MPYFRRINNEGGDVTPFKVVPWTGQGSGWMVGDGAIFSTFSYGTGSFIPIQGQYTQLLFKPQEKIYIDMMISPNLQVTGAKIMCAKVAFDAGTVDNKSSPTYWYNYPNMTWISPQDEFNTAGMVTKIVDGKRQTNCYALIAYRSDDSNKNGDSHSNATNGSNGSSSPVQILNTDLMMMTSIQSGIPVAIPIPYLGGTAHLQGLRNG